MPDRLLTTGELAKELGVSRAAVLSWATREWITPAFVTGGGHYRWKVEDVRAELAARRHGRESEDR